MLLETQFVLYIYALVTYAVTNKQANTQQFICLTEFSPKVKIWVNIKLREVASVM